MIVRENTKIFVACPSNVATGGPELLHQLVYKLSKFGLNAYMYYYNIKSDDPVHDEYKIYNNKYITEIEDNNNNVIIIPEIKTDLIYEFKNIQKVIWWLSVDNYLKSTYQNGIKSFIKKYIEVILGKQQIKRFFKFQDLPVTHFVQSEYARQFLTNKGIKKNIFYLSDYINSEFIKQQDIAKYNKDNIVVYNPKKGYKFTQKLIKKNKFQMKFVPIENMTRKQVGELLKKAKVYIDFGNHPGKDRIPREAAISGCCVIVGKRGSANYYEDVPIDDEFKFEYDYSKIDIILEKIYDCISTYNDNIKKFEYYREFIRKEEKKFEDDIYNIFVKGEAI